eukprot:11488361-Ditylum_brightwellii.AAC.1
MTDIERSFSKVKGHGTTGKESMDRNVPGEEVQCSTNFFAGQAEFGGEDRGRKQVPCAVFQLGKEWGVNGSVVGL